MVFLLRKKATATAKAAKENEALKQQVLQLQMQQQQFHQQQQQLQHPSSHQHNQATPKVVNGEALSAMSIQYDSERISQNPTYAPSNSISTTSSSSTTKPGSATGPAADAAPSTISANGQSSEPIDQLLARGDSDTNASTSTARNASSPSFRRTSSAHASITAHSQKLPPLHSTVASTSSSYYPSSSGNNGNSPALPANASSSSHTHYNTHKSPSSYGYYRSETDKHARSGSVSSESSYAASETSDVLHNSVGGRSSSGGTTATTPGSTMDKDQSYSSQRKNSLAMTPSQQQQPQQHQHSQHQQAQSQRPVSIERIPVPGNASPSTPSSARQAGTKSALSGVTPADATSVQASPALSSSSSFARKTASRYTLTDFSFQRTLGTGSFGRVHLVRSCHNMRFYAVKVLNKERVVRMKQVEHTNSEREMLERVRHPFLVNLWGTFKDSHNLYMVMDFVSGGELFSLLRKSQRFPDAVAKFFAAEVALALDYLHSLDIIYRDLKPENILLAADGHVKITDFGFAKYVPDITWTLCGTPDYLAPEIVQSKGYNKSVDWYALGVLIFEMLAGYPPFFTEDSNPMRLYEKIIAGKVRYPSYFTEEAKDLLRNLLTGDLSKRFGNLANGSRDIFGHSYFTEVDWNRLYKKEIPAPYVPRVESDGDSSNFDVYAEIDVSEYGQMGADPHGHLFTCF